MKSRFINASRKLNNAYKREGFLGFTKLLLSRIVLILMALPLAMCLVAISPWIRVRFIQLYASRIGHYALNTELLLCALDLKIFGDKTNCKYLFYAPLNQPICNLQLHRMWKRVIPVLPFASYFKQVDRLLIRWLGASYSNDPIKSTFEESAGARDRWNLLERVKHAHIAFTQPEIEAGQALLEKLGIPRGAPFVCLLGRDPVYLNTHLPTNDWSYHNYRNVEINNYRQAAEFLAENGYYVVRMGKHVGQKFQVNHPKVIDYANHSLRSDFLDIYLTAHCLFFISPRTGIDAVAQIFRRPLLLTDFPMCDYKALYALNLVIPKKVMDSKTGRLLTIAEMCWDWESERKQKLQALQQNELRFIDNTPEEILEVTKEMLGRLTNTWADASETNILQTKFWEKVPLGSTELGEMAIKMRIGENFIRNHQALLN